MFLQIVRARTFTIKIRKQKINRTIYSKIETTIKIDIAIIIAIIIRATIDKLQSIIQILRNI